MHLKGMYIKNALLLVELPDMEYGSSLGSRGASEYTLTMINMLFLLIMQKTVPTKGLVMVGDDFRSMIFHLPISCTWDGEPGWVWVATLNGISKYHPAYNSQNPSSRKKRPVLYNPLSKVWRLNQSIFFYQTPSSRKHL